MNDLKFKRFDMSMPPKRMRWFLRPIANFIAASGVKKHHTKFIYNCDLDKINGPFIVLCNHNAFLDMNVAFTVLKKKRANFVVAIDGFIGREWLLRNVGCICKRKFTNDITLIKQFKTVLDKGDCCVIYPEARYSLCGTTALLPESLGKMVKLFKVPVVSIMCNGHHINHPFYDTSHERGVDDEATISLLFNKDDIDLLSVDEINKKLVDAFYYDDYKWQKENKVVVDDPNRADGLDKILYQCPCCKSEYEMSSDKDKLICNHCGKEWLMDEYGQLKALSGETEFTHIPDWYEWQRLNVRKEVENGTYNTGIMPVNIKSLPNAKKFIDIGEGTLIHNMDGFVCKLNDPSKSDTTEIIIDAPSLYSVHVEYRYLFKYGDCVDLNTLKDTWYIYPHDCKFNVTKISLAVEELYRYYKIKAGKEVKKGLA